MKILVIGGMHGNETLGIELVRSLLKNPIEGIEATIANQPAIDMNTRFTTQDLNRSFPGKLDSNQFEDRRAAELVELSKSFDIVLDFHNTYCPDNDCSFVGESVDEQLFGASSFLGLTRVIVADYECINKYATNCISIEISMQSKLNDVAVWREKITSLQRQVSFMTQTTVEKYRFVYRMTLEDRDKFNLDNKNLRAFKLIDPEIAQAMNLESPAYPIFIADTFTPYNYGGIVERYC